MAREANQMSDELRHKLETLRDLAGSAAKDWTYDQLLQLDYDMDEMAELLLELYQQKKQHNRHPQER